MGASVLHGIGDAPTMPLTDVVLRKVKSSGKRCKLFDERGLYLEVSPNGGRWWRLKYRFGGREKRLALGVYPDVGLKDAREGRDAAKRNRAADCVRASSFLYSVIRTAGLAPLSRRRRAALPVGRISLSRKVAKPYPYGWCLAQ